MERTAQYQVPAPRVDAETDWLVPPGSKIWQPVSDGLVQTASP
jgi:hypothetical protein